MCEWIPVENKRPTGPCVVCDSLGNVFVPVGLLTIETEDSNGNKREATYDARNYDFNIEEFLKGVPVPYEKNSRILPREIVAWIPLPAAYARKGGRHDKTD